MTKAQQLELKQKLLKIGYHGSVHQRGPSWRVTVSKFPQHLESYTVKIKTRYHLPREEPETLTTISRPRQLELSKAFLLAWFRANGYADARIMRAGSSEIVFEIDHAHNIWKHLIN